MKGKDQNFLKIGYISNNTKDRVYEMCRSLSYNDPASGCIDAPDGVCPDVSIQEYIMQGTSLAPSDNEWRSDVLLDIFKKVVNKKSNTIKNIVDLIKEDIDKYKNSILLSGKTQVYIYQNHHFLGFFITLKGNRYLSFTKRRLVPSNLTTHRRAE